MELATASTSTVSLDERAFSVDAAASLHMMCKTDLFPGELETAEVTRFPTPVITANGSIVTQAKHFVCSTFKLFEDPKSATQNKEVAFKARSRLQTRCLSSKCASASGCATKGWSVLTQTIHPQRHISSVNARTPALHAVFHFYLRGSRSTGGSAHRVKKESVHT